MPVPPPLFRPAVVADAFHLPPGSQWIVVCGASLAILYALLRSGRRRRGSRDPLAREPTQTSLAQQRSVERQMQTLLVELAQMAQEITAKLDTRATKLALLIDDADEKAARLQQSIDGCRDAVAALSRPPPPAPVPEPVEVPALRPAFEPSLALPGAVDARHRAIYDLADQGHSPADIARQLDRQLGEIELILALRAR